MIIERPLYIDKLKQLQMNGHCKVMYGMRFCGKTELIHTFISELYAAGVAQTRILYYEFNDWAFSHLTDGELLRADILSRLPSEKTSKPYYIFLDDFHHVQHFEIVLDTLKNISYADIYISTNNISFLETFKQNTDFYCNFIPLYSVSYKEYRSCCLARNIPEASILSDYMQFGGLPFILCKKTAAEKRQALLTLLQAYAIPDITSNYHLRSEKILSDSLNTLAIHVGETKSYLQLSKDIRVHTATSKSNEDTSTASSSATLKKYVSCLTDAFVIYPSKKCNLTKNQYYDSHARFYFSDYGILNACLNFDKASHAQLLSNMIFNELIFDGYSVDTGVYDYYTKDKTRKTIRNTCEIDFVARKGASLSFINLATTDEEYTEKLNLLKHIKLPGKKMIISKEKEVRQIP